MKSASDERFPYAEQVLGYRLSHHRTQLSNRVETNREVIEVIEVWSGTIQRVMHLGANDASDLIEWDGTEVFLVRPALGTLMCEVGEKLSMVSVEGSRIPLAENTVMHLKHGLHHTLVRRVKGGRRVGLSPIGRGESTFVAALMLCGTMGALFALLVAYLPIDATLEGHELDDRFAHILLLKEKVQETKPRKVAPKIMEPDESANNMAKVSKRDGGGNGKRFGAEKAKNLETVRSAGILGAMNNGSVLSDSAIDMGMIQAIGGNPKGKTVGGTLGLGNRHGGFGDGPGVDGSLGTLSGPIASGATPGDLCAQSGMNCTKMGRRISVTAEPSIQIGALSRGEVDEVIKRNLSRIKYCYQKQAQRDASLLGKVVSTFTIAKDGSVSSARIKQSSLQSPEVERCLTKTIQRLQFPKPRGGGFVLVTYPFSFQAV